MTAEERLAALLLLAALLGLSLWLPARGDEPFSADARVNDVLTDSQSAPDIAVDSRGWTHLLRQDGCDSRAWNAEAGLRLRKQSLRIPEE